LLPIPITGKTLTGLQLLAIVAVVLGTVALLWGAIEYGERIYLIRHGPDDIWITAPQPAARAAPIRIGRQDPDRLVFHKEFRLATVPDHAVVRIRALRELALSVNGKPVDLAGRDPRRWKRATEVDVATLLRPGPNHIAADVVNPEGPPLLQISSDDLGARLTGVRGWIVHRGESRRPAVVANDVRRYPYAAQLPVPFQVLARRWMVLLAIFAFCALPAVWRVPWPGVLGGANWPRTAFAAMVVFWSTLFVVKALHFPLALGFDGDAHISYIEFLAREQRIPRADEGWSAFHPPLYHAATAALRALFHTDRGSLLDRVLLHLLPMASGLASAWLAGRIMRRLSPGAPGVAAVATVAAGLLPMSVYMSTFASNEPVHAALIASGLWLTCTILTAERTSPALLAGLSTLLGLALLTKSTSGAPLALVMVLLVGVKLWLVEARGWGRSTLGAAGILVGPIVLSGWFYWRNWQLFGSPFVTNLESFAAWTYWMPPGFHTPEWFLGFGEVLVHPFFSSFASYWDGFYSSFWGDGYASGRAGVKYPNPWWDYDSMAAVYPLALPATGLLGIGLLVALVDALRGDHLGRRLGWTLMLVAIYAMMLLPLIATLRMPYNAMPKAFYALPAVVPMAVCFAAGVGWVHDLLAGPGHRVLRATLYGYLGMLVVSIAFAFLN
jgi:hypothetical protein